MMGQQSIAIGGWLATGLAVAVALLGRRSRAARMEIVARACHELRGPVTAARLGLQLGARTGELSPATLGAIDLELGRASLALEDLSAAHNGLRPARTCEEVDIGKLLDDTVEAWRPSAAARDRQIELQWAGDRGRVWGDRLRLAQATGNLLANAIEHGGGVIEVRGRVEGAGVRLEVIDGGPGLPAPVDQLARRAWGGRPSRGRGLPWSPSGRGLAWSPSGRGSAWPPSGRGLAWPSLGRGRAWPPRGRGLAIAAEIAEGHGGRLAVAPSERGARLVLELPAALGERTCAAGPGRG